MVERELRKVQTAKDWKKKAAEKRMVQERAPKLMLTYPSPPESSYAPQGDCESLDLESPALASGPSVGVDPLSPLPQQSDALPVPPSVRSRCFHCGREDHRSRQCSQLQPQVVVRSSRRVDAQVVTRISSGRSKKKRKRHDGVNRGRLGHVRASDVQDVPDVVLGEFLVCGCLASVLFDSGATYSYISTQFVAKQKVPTVLLKTPTLTTSPLGTYKCTLGCQRVSILIEGVQFLADLVVLPSDGIDLILGMDWLSRNKGVISCADRVVTLVNHQ